jgi:hypothetical protein
MHYQQVAPHAYCGAEGPVSKMASQQEKAYDHLLPWPPRSPNLTPCDFFLWGFVEDSVYIPPLPMSLRELRDRITRSLQNITADHWGDQVKKTEMGRTCGTYGGEERCIQGFGGAASGKESIWKTEA